MRKARFLFSFCWKGFFSTICMEAAPGSVFQSPLNNIYNICAFPNENWHNPQGGLETFLRRDMNRLMGNGRTSLFMLFTIFFDHYMLCNSISKLLNWRNKINWLPLRKKGIVHTSWVCSCDPKCKVNAEVILLYITQPALKA